MWQSSKNAREEMKESEISDQDSVELDALEQNENSDQKTTEE